MVIWNEQYQKLIVGSLDDDLIFPGGDQGRAGIVTGAGPRREGSWFSRTRGVAHAQSGAGDTDGTPVLQEAGWTTAGIVLNSQTALGYLTITSGIVATDWTAPTYNNTLLHRNGPSNTVAVLQDYYTHATPAPSTYTTSGTDSAPIIVQKLVKDTLAQFQKSSPQSFVLVANTGPKLIWYNGHTTQGNSDYPVVVNFGGDPCPYDAIVSSDGRTHFGGPDAVERSINWLKSDVADELGQEHALSIRVRYGDWNFTRILHSYGTVAEFTGQNEFGDFDYRNNAISIVGEGPQVTQLNTFATDDLLVSDPKGNVNIRANRIVLKGLTFTQEFDNTGLRDPRYTLFLRANEVIIEDCVFHGGVAIESQNITIKNCRFYGLGNGVAAPHAVQQAGGTEYVGQHLHLRPRDDSTAIIGTTLARWEIEGCSFHTNIDWGTHASVVLSDNSVDHLVSPTFKLTTRIHRNEWYTEVAQPQEQPSIHIDSWHHGIEIDNNRFLHANGTTKPGADLVVAPPPFDGYLDGSPVSLPGGTNTTRRVTTAYISLVKLRSRDSSLNVHDNFFDLSDVGYLATGTFNLWGAMIIYPSVDSIAPGGTIPAGYNCIAHVSFNNNKVKMGGGLGTWDALIPGVVNATWGFYAAVSTPDAATFSVVFNDTAVNDNFFDLGGADNDFSKIWRSIRGEALNSWPGAGTGYLTDPSCLVGVVMKNASGGVNPALTHYANGVSICRNRMLQSWSGTGPPIYGPIIFTDNDPSYWWPTLICVTANNPLYFDANQTTPSVNSDGALITAVPYVIADVSYNTMSTSAYAGGLQNGFSLGGSELEETSPGLGEAPHVVYFSGVTHLTFNGNYMQGGDRTQFDGFSAVWCNKSLQNTFIGNQFHDFTRYISAVGPSAAENLALANQLDYAGFASGAQLNFFGGQGSNFQAFV
jgi:hypothetical protein